MNPNELTEKLFADLGIQNPDESLKEKLTDHFAVVIAEVLLRRAPQARLSEIKEKIEKDASDLELLIADIASDIPGLGQEIEEALSREYESLRKLLT